MINNRKFRRDDFLNSAKNMSFYRKIKSNGILEILGILAFVFLCFFIISGLFSSGLKNKHSKISDEILNAPFVARSQNVSDMYDRCVNEKYASYCLDLANYEKSQMHIKNYLHFLNLACLNSIDYCVGYADRILYYYKDKELAKTQALKYYQMACDDGVTSGCSSVLELKGY
jgi:hypothetical protein